MAANLFDPPPLGADLFDIYNDNAAVARSIVPQLPNGACNFVDLTPGTSGSRCGCRRFWSRHVPGSPVLDQSGWCMCNHHACYHDEGTREGQQPESATAAAAGQENERPRTGREPLSPVLDMTTKETIGVLGPEFGSFVGSSQLSFLRKPFDGDYTLGVTASPQQGASMPDTLAWADFIQSQPDTTATAALPPIPPQCLMSQTASTTSSVQARYLRPFSGKGLETLGNSTVSKQAPSLQQQLSNPQNSLLAAVSQQKASSAEDSFIFVTADEGSTPRPGTATTQIEPRVSASELMPQEALKNLTDAVGVHAQRLDRLETISFSAAVHDECHDRHDQLDLRLAELESRMEDVEKTGLDNDTSANRRGGRHDEYATPSVVSIGCSVTSRPSYSQEIQSQLQSLHAQVAQLQSAIPSYNHAWEVEVVFLPFPLKRVWQHLDQFKVDPATGNGDDWTQLPMTHSTPTMRSQSPFFGDWTTSDHDTEWLLPRACGDKSITDKRLRSRGLVRKVSVKGPDARSVQSAMNLAFGNVFRDMQMHTRSHGPDPRLAKFMGLQSAWVPLRKIHKDSRLRFLSPDEMVTSALWDVQFLNSVMMRSSEPRLFVTHPDAYLQDYQSYEAGWTWQKLRETARIYPDITESQEVPEADALEGCWTWNEQLDEALSAQISEGHRQERQRVSISPSISYFPAVQSWRSASRAVARDQSPMLKSRKGSRPPHIRTSSMPITAAVHQSPASANPKRRVVSNGQSWRSSPNVQVAPGGGIMKRRRTRSPSHARFTPRWTKSPSPMPFGLLERQTTRGTTPFAYATPYSNAPLQEVRMVRGSSIFHNEPQYPTDDEDDDDYNIQIYESDSDESFGDAEDDDNDENEHHDDDDDDMESIASAQPMVTHAEANPQHDSQSLQLPEDEPWPGIEDQGRPHRSDGENIDPYQTGPMSDASSQPSEYPSTQSAWPRERDAPLTGFHIHEDE